jgi:hypothetical protein
MTFSCSKEKAAPKDRLREFDVWCVSEAIPATRL